MSNCFVCTKEFDDTKSVVQCTKCYNYFHATCEKVELRGFHMKRTTWVCKSCTESQFSTSRPRNKTQDEMDDDLIGRLFQMVADLSKTTEQMQSKLDLILLENRSLREEVASLKKINNLAREDNKDYASAVANKLLLIRPKEKSDDINKTRVELKNRVNPAEIGVGLTVGDKTRSGGVVVRYRGSKNIKEIQDKIQSDMGQNYEVVERRNDVKCRLKIVGLDEEEMNETDDLLMKKMISQNDLKINGDNVKVVYRGKIRDRKFNMNIEVDKNAYEYLKVKEKLFIGWSRCVVYEDLGVMRCYNCCNYSHLAKVCKNKTCCPKCSGEHRGSECKSENKKCINCSNANEKFKLNLDTAHCVWDKDCACFLRRVEQKRNYLISGNI